MLLIKPRHRHGIYTLLTETGILQASVNVGGTVLNVLSIEHLILRHSPEGKQVRKISLHLFRRSTFKFLI